MEKKTLTIRSAEPKDYPDILRLNADNVSVLAPMDGEGIRRFADWAELFWVVEADGVFAAFLIALREGNREYWSENYKWFSAHYPQFLYIDRIVVKAAYRGYGIGQRLYELAAAHARNTGVPVLTAEIDTEPVYNDASHVLRASCWSAAKLFMPIASQFCFLSAHSLNSASVLRCHSFAASGVIPSTSQLTVLLSVRPTPTTFVRLVLMADVATGDAM